MLNFQGNRAIAEIQFADYIFPAFDQVCPRPSFSPLRFLLYLFSTDHFTMIDCE